MISSVNSSFDACYTDLIKYLNDGIYDLKYSKLHSDILDSFFNKDIYFLKTE